MTNLCKLKLNISIYIADELADDFGKELAVFLRESFFNGEDVFEVDYAGHDVLN